MVEPDFIPSTPLDLMVLREKFVEAVRRHLLAEVTLAITVFLMLCIYGGRSKGPYWDSFSYGHERESVIFLSQRDRLKRFFQYFIIFW
jgi:hypothetical protein